MVEESSSAIEQVVSFDQQDHEEIRALAEENDQSFSTQLGQIYREWKEMRSTQEAIMESFKTYGERLRASNKRWKERRDNLEF